MRYLVVGDTASNAPLDAKETTTALIIHNAAVLYKLIRTLNISPDSIFYPEKPSKDSEVENLLRMLSACDDRSLEVVKATAKALIDTASEK